MATKLTKPKLCFRPECGPENRFGHTYGPFEFLQLTYGELRISPDGDSAMVLVGNKWKFTGEVVGHGIGVVAHADDVGQVWTDIVISVAEEG